ncbi:hypothetical protein JMJ77_0005854, partial [Colletotrichum scovillei]
RIQSLSSFKERYRSVLSLNKVISNSLSLILFHYYQATKSFVDRRYHIITKCNCLPLFLLSSQALPSPALLVSRFARLPIQLAIFAAKIASLGKEAMPSLRSV